MPLLESQPKQPLSQLLFRLNRSNILCPVPSHYFIRGVSLLSRASRLPESHQSRDVTAQLLVANRASCGYIALEIKNSCSNALLSRHAQSKGRAYFAEYLSLGKFRDIFSVEVSIQWLPLLYSVLKVCRRHFHFQIKFHTVKYSALVSSLQTNDEIENIYFLKCGLSGVATNLLGYDLHFCDWSWNVSDGKEQSVLHRIKRGWG